MSIYYTSQGVPNATGGASSSDPTAAIGGGQSGRGGGGGRAFPSHMYDEYDDEEDDHEGGMAAAGASQRWRRAQRQQQQQQQHAEYYDDPHQQAAAEGHYDGDDDEDGIEYGQDPFRGSGGGRSRAQRAGDDDEFDVAADFNNVGPRYSQMYGGAGAASMGQMTASTAGGGVGSGMRPQASRSGLHQMSQVDRPSSLHAASYYSDIAPLHPNGSDSGETIKKGGYGQGRPKRKTLLDTTDPTGTELVTVPALGAEWDKDEVHAMSRRGKKDFRSERRARAWTEWRRDQRGLCGIGWLTYRRLIFLVFAIIVAVALVLFFTIPRAPKFTFPSGQIFSIDNSTVSFSRTPANFSYAGSLEMIVDASSSYLPVHFKELDISVYDINTNKQIGSGSWRGQTVPRSNYHFVTLPVEFSYAGVNASDATWLDMYNACGHLWPGTTRPDLQFRVVLDMHIAGLVTTPSTSASVTGLTCPYELPSNGV